MSSREKQITRITFIGMAVNAVLTAFKFIAGLAGRSSAMIADSVHSLSDFISDIIILVFLRISLKGRDKTHDFGHGKFETMATFILSIILIAVAAQILANGIKDIMSVLHGEEIQAPSRIALIAALVSIIAKEFCYQITARVGRRVNSPAVIANAWHHRSDALSSIGTALGIGGAVLLGGRWAILDPLASIVVAAFIVKVSIDLMRKGINELMEASLPDDTEAEILEIVKSFSDVTDPHNLKTRRIGNRIAIEIHVRMNPDVTLSTAHERATDIEHALKERFGKNTHVVVHMEPIK